MFTRFGLFWDKNWGKVVGGTVAGAIVNWGHNKVSLVLCA
jgi:hypothetical protein